MAFAQALSASGRGGAVDVLLTQADRVVIHHAKLLRAETYSPPARQG